MQVPICQHCGQVSTNNPQGRSIVSGWVAQMERDHSVKCFCKIPYPLLKDLFASLDTKLSSLCKQAFPEARNPDEILAAIGEMDRYSPLGREIFIRRGYLQRLKEVMAERRDLGQDTEVLEEPKDNEEKEFSPGRMGEGVSINQWLEDHSW